MKRVITIIVMSLLVYACTPTEEDVKGNDNSRFKENPDKVSDKVYCRERPDFCTQEFNPVVADNGKQYSNGCTACSDESVTWFMLK